MKKPRHIFLALGRNSWLILLAPTLYEEAGLSATVLLVTVFAYIELFLWIFDRAHARFARLERFILEDALTTAKAELNRATKENPQSKQNSN